MRIQSLLSLVLFIITTTAFAEYKQVPGRGRFWRVKDTYYGEIQARSKGESHSAAEMYCDKLGLKLPTIQQALNYVDHPATDEDANYEIMWTSEKALDRANEIAVYQEFSTNLFSADPTKLKSFRCVGKNLIPPKQELPVKIVEQPPETQEICPANANFCVGCERKCVTISAKVMEKYYSNFERWMRPENQIQRKKELHYQIPEVDSSVIAAIVWWMETGIAQNSLRNELPTALMAARTLSLPKLYLQLDNDAIKNAILNDNLDLLKFLGDLKDPNDNDVLSYVRKSSPEVRAASKRVFAYFTPVYSMMLDLYEIRERTYTYSPESKAKTAEIKDLLTSNEEEGERARKEVTFAGDALLNVAANHCDAEIMHFLLENGAATLKPNDLKFRVFEDKSCAKEVNRLLHLAKDLSHGIYLIYNSNEKELSYSECKLVVQFAKREDNYAKLTSIAKSIEAHGKSDDEKKLARKIRKIDWKIYEKKKSNEANRDQTL